MARPIWTGTISFGLVNVPVSLVSVEKKGGLDFHFLDKRDKKPIRYQRVNADTGEEVAWKDLVKAYEYEKGHLVVVEKEDIARAAPKTHETVELFAFVPAESIAPRYFEKPYLLVPGKKAEKGYALLRDTLQGAGRWGLAKVVVRTREYLAALLPEENALYLELLRYPAQLRQLDEFELPGDAKASQPSAAEKKMATQLIESMTTEWEPEKYKDEFEKKLGKVIQQRIDQDEVVTQEPETEGTVPATNVVDFVELLKKSLAKKGDSAKGSPRKATPRTKKVASSGARSHAKKTARGR